MKSAPTLTCSVRQEETPLINVTIDVALSRQRTVEEHTESLGDVLVISGRMEAMVERLLMMARIDAKSVYSKSP